MMILGIALIGGGIIVLAIGLVVWIAMVLDEACQ